MNKLTFEISEKLKFNFNVVALKEKRSMSDLLRELIENYVAQKQS